MLFDILARMPASLPPLVDEIIRARRKTIAILVQRDGKVIVRAPVRAPMKLIQDFVESKKDWIKEKKALMQNRAVTPARHFVDGEKFLFLGEKINLRVVPDGTQRAALSLNKEFLLSKKAQPAAMSVFEKWYKLEAQRIMAERVTLYAEKHGFRYQKIRISSARTRWGSCSSRGTLSFCWRLVMAPMDVIDYVVVHELAHLKIKNHSDVFWNEVNRLMPTYKIRRDWLKKNGLLLTLDGE